MKAIQLVAIIVLTTTLFACKKDKDESVSVPGHWTGWWSSGSSSTQNNMTTIFRDNGTVRVLYGYTSDTTTASFKSEGTYTIDGETLRFRYNEGANVFIHKSNITRNMNGTWGHTPSETNGGLFALTKR